MDAVVVIGVDALRSAAADAGIELSADSWWRPATADGDECKYDIAIAAHDGSWRDATIALAAVKS